MTDRRSFLQLGAGAALVAAEACTLGPTDERIVPFVHETPEVTPGKPAYYATALAYRGFARPVVATTQAGRPVKIDGNPEHPAMLGGGSTAFEQASLHDLYNDGRVKHVMRGRDLASISTLSDFIAGFSGPLTLVLEATTSPTVLRLVTELAARRPQTRVFYTGRHSDAMPVYDFSGLECLVSFDSDVTESSALAVRYARQLGDSRRERSTRIYAVETAPRGLGLIADHRMPVRPSVTYAMLTALAKLLGITNETASLSDSEQRFVRAMHHDLTAARANSFVLCDENAPAAVRALVHAINRTLSPARTRWIASPVIGDQSSFDGAALLNAMADALVVTIGADPARDVPGFHDALVNSHASVTFGLYSNATSRASTWSAPLSHAFETWMDLCSGDGQLTLAQPLVRPLFETLGVLDVLGWLADPRHEVAPGYARSAVQKTFGAGPLEGALSRGFVPRTPAIVDAPSMELSALAPAAPGLELNTTHFDGLNNPWLLELPQPVTSLTWENAALVSKNTARELDLKTGDVVRLNDSVEIPVLITPGHADGALTVQLGWGSISAATGTVLGVDVAKLTGPIRLVKTGRSTALAVTQTHVEHREAVTRVTTEMPTHAHASHDEPSLHHAKPGEDGKALGGLLGAQQWGMAIDMSTCTGCGTCAIACQVENNIPVVGKTSVLRNRHMHWLRIDTVIADANASTGGTLVQQPMLCQHCEAAPCEYVCPVNATTHSPDGINEMTYNRCVGTRFCSNNCPYKVRRFNWYDFTRDTPAVTQLAFNPNVTVRARGVMEKCTFCVQRVRRAGIDARLQSRSLRTDEVTTACSQACPTGAIVFGDLADKRSTVNRLHARADAYGALAETGTRPRVRYLPRLLNQNAELKS